MLPETYLVNEIEVGIQDFLWRMSRQHTDEQADNAFHDKGIAFGGKMNHFLFLSVTVTVSRLHQLRNKPYAALATVDEVLLRLVFLVQRLLFIA